MYDMFYAASLAFSAIIIVAVIAEKWIRMAATWRNHDR